MYKKILLAIDNSASSQSALLEAVELASAYRASVRVLHIVSMPCAHVGYLDDIEREEFLGALMSSGKKIIKHAIDTFRDEGLNAKAVMVQIGERPVADEILSQANQWPADLILLGTHAASVHPRTGSNTRKVIAESSIAVLSLNAKGERVAHQSTAQCSLHARPSPASSDGLPHENPAKRWSPASAASTAGRADYR